MPRTPSPRIVLRSLERIAGLLRKAGIGSLVDGPGLRAANVAARFTTVELDGLRLGCRHVGQLYYLRELSQSHREDTLVRIMRDVVEPGSVVVDGGAHVGYVTLQLARAVGPAGRVFAFEANPEVRAVLEGNLRRNGLASQVTVVRSALGAARGRAAFHLSGGGDTSSLADQGTTRRVVVVDVTTLDEVLGDLVPSVIKLDLEGGEVDALRGMRRVLERAGDGLVVFAECNPGALRAAGTTADDLLEELRSHGFEVMVVNETGGCLTPFDGSVAAPGYLNLACARGAAFERLERAGGPHTHTV